MDLFNIARNAVGAVNPEEEVTISLWTGYTTDSTGKVTPTYTDTVLMAQVQPSANNPIDQNGVRRNRIQRTFYLHGDWNAIDRTIQKGRCTILYNNQIWIVDSVSEIWKDWVCVSTTLQLDEVVQNG